MQKKPLKYTAIDAKIYNNTIIDIAKALEKSIKRKTKVKLNAKKR